MLRSALIVATALVSGCLVSVDYGGTGFQCADLVCPDGFSCVAGECVIEGSVVLPGAFRRRLDLVDDGADLSGFPLLIRLDAASIDYATAGAGGSTLRFTDLDGDLLPHEIDTWDEAGVSTVWVRVPRVLPASSDDALLMYWGASEPPTAPAATAVWDDTFVGVWHLDDDPGAGAADAVLDSTDTSAHGTTNPEMTASSVVAGQIGAAMSFRSSPGDAVNVGDLPELALPVYTWTAWVRSELSPMTGMGNGQPIYNADDQFNFAWNHSDTDKTQAATHRDSSGFLHAQIATPLEADRWYLIGATYDGTELTVFLDGQAETSIALGAPVDEPGVFAIGNDPAAPAFTGFVDDVQVSNRARSPAFIAAMHAAATGTGLVEFGALETL